MLQQLDPTVRSWSRWQVPAQRQVPIMRGHTPSMMMLACQGTCYCCHEAEDIASVAWAIQSYEIGAGLCDNRNWVSFSRWLRRIERTPSCTVQNGVQNVVQMVHVAEFPQVQPTPRKAFSYVHCTRLLTILRFSFKTHTRTTDINLSQLDGDGLVLRVVRQRSLAELATHTGLLVSTERYLPVMSLVSMLNKRRVKRQRGKKRTSGSCCSSSPRRYQPSAHCSHEWQCSGSWCALQQQDRRWCREQPQEHHRYP